MKGIAALAGLMVFVLACAETAWALDVDATIAEAESLLAKGPFDSALDAANKAVAAAASNPETYQCRFRVYVARAQDEDALADINRAIELAPGSAKYLAARAELRLDRAEYGAALKDLDAAVAADEAYVPAYRLRARANLGAQRPDPAIEDADMAVVLAPDNADAYVVRGDVRAARGDAAAARTDYVKATELAPNGADAWYGLGACELAQGSYEAALTALDKAVELSPYRVLAYVKRAEARIGTGNEALVEPALQDLAKAIELDGSCAQARYVRATVERKREDLAGAVADLRTALALEPGNATYRALWDTIFRDDSKRLMDEAEAFLNDGKFDEAAARVRKALEIDPASEAFHEALSIIEAQREKRGK